MTAVRNHLHFQRLFTCLILCLQVLNIYGQTVPPVLENIETEPIIYNKGDGPVTITNTLTITVAHSKTIHSALIFFDSGYVPNEDRLRYTPYKGIEGSFNEMTGLLSLTGLKNSVEDFIYAIRSVRYENINLVDPAQGSRVIDIVVNDGKINSLPVYRIIIIDSAPVLSSIETLPLNYCLNSDPVNITGTITITDENDALMKKALVWVSQGYEEGIDSLSFISTAGITGYFDSMKGTLSLTGKASKSDYENALHSVQFEKKEMSNVSLGSRIISITVSDGIKESNILTRRIYLLPTIRIAGQNFFEDFEDNPPSWQSNSEGDLNSWLFGDPLGGFSEHPPNNKYWHTFLNNAISEPEQSWISSPCFDLSGTIRPMVKLDIQRSFDGIRNGATLQVSTDKGNSWKILGDLQDGINWFNQYDILGEPGGQPIGWSNTNDPDWVEARHSLDDYMNEKSLLFRIVYGSDGTAMNSSGIAFDNFWIGEREKVALIEHFTNASDLLSTQADQLINDITANCTSNVVTLQYHVKTSEPDPLADQDASLASARLFYYGLTEIPVSMIDGGYNESLRFEYDQQFPDTTDIIVQTLLDNNFHIDLTSSVVGNTLDAEAMITATQSVPMKNLTLYLTVTEDSVRVVAGGNDEFIFRNVVRAMLPDVAGITFSKFWEKGESEQVIYSWNLEHVSDLSQLQINAFIQDETTKEILQATRKTVTIITTPDERYASRKEFMIYPDPVTDLVTLSFKEPIPSKVQFTIFNSQGLAMKSGHIIPGINETQLPAQELTGGIYLIRITFPDGSLITGKFIVKHQ